VDWDNDGDHDLLVGDGVGYVYIFLNINNNTNPELDGGTRLQDSNGDMDIGNRAAPIVYDWDKDGLDDLLIGSYTGYIFIYLNVGTEENPAFDWRTYLEVGGAIFRATEDANQWEVISSPRIFDWNGDGLDDLLVGQIDGYVYYLENVAASANVTPVFNTYEKLLLDNGEPLKYGSVEDPLATPRSRLYVTDWNNDGENDILLGGNIWDSVALEHISKLELYLAEGPTCTDIDDDTYTTCDGDCDDNDPYIYPGGPPVRVIGASLDYYPSLQTAYNAALEGDTVQSQDVVLIEDLSIELEKSIALESGYDCGFSTTSGITTINGNMIINNGVFSIESGTIEIL
jgi:hypothetical protein